MKAIDVLGAHPVVGALSEGSLDLAKLGGLAAGTVAGALVWKKHRVLGALAGGRVGSTAVVVGAGTPSERNLALIHLGVVESASVMGSLLWKKHPALGYIAGLLAASVPVWVATKALKEKARQERAYLNRLKPQQAIRSATVL